MLLRTRITAMAAAALLLAALGWTGAGALREQLLEQRLSAAVRAAHAALWDQALAQQDRELSGLIDKLMLQPGLEAAVREADTARLQQLMVRAGTLTAMPQTIELAALLASGRAPLLLHGQLPRELLDADSLERAVVGDAVDGLRVISAQQALVLATRRIAGTDAVLVLGRDARHALRGMAERTGAVVTLLDLRGRLLASTDAALGQLSAEHAVQRSAQRTELELGERSYLLSSSPVDDLAGHAAGTVLALLDHTPDARAHAFLGRLALGGTLALLLLLLLALNWYLRRSLRPLERSIDALQALAQGDADVRLPAGGDDEIGRIARAVATFRRNAQELAATRALRERVRRRQERLLRTRLQVLAQATHQPLSWQGGGSDEEQLRQLAAVMGELSDRLIDQHQRLTGMVQELREALVTKTRLAGLEQELQIAAQVQLSILPRNPPQDARVQLHCHITPAREVGGDFYDYFFIDEQPLGFVIADVSGKGVPAALFMTITRTLLKATAQFITEPTHCLSQLNDLLAAENEQMMFVTLFYGVLHLDSGQVQYVNAGHNPPYVLRADASVQPLARTGGMAVAVSEGFPYRSASVQLQPGDLLLLYTDGVTEAFDPDGQEFGDARLLHTLQQLSAAGPLQAQPLAAGVLAAVHAFERGAPQADDITCMALRYQGSQGQQPVQ